MYSKSAAPSHLRNIIGHPNVPRKHLCPKKEPAKDGFHVFRTKMGRTEHLKINISIYLTLLSRKQTCLLGVNEKVE